MPPTGTFDWARVDVAVPPPSVRLPGIDMAGFGHRAPVSVDIAMVAHPSVTLLIDLSEDDGIVCRTPGRHERGSVVAGLAPGDFRATGRGCCECLQIRLEPVAAAAVLGASPELSGTLVSLEDVWGRDAERVEDRLRTAASWNERFTTAVDVLGRLLDTRPPVDPEVAHTWQRTLAGRGRVRVDDLAAEVGWSRKRLWSRFRSQLGITPKRAARLVRFDHAARLLAAGRPAANVAVESGYADQSHLHREAKAFTGLTPTAVATAPWLAIDDVAWPASSPRTSALAPFRPHEKSPVTRTYGRCSPQRPPSFRLVAAQRTWRTGGRLSPATGPLRPNGLGLKDNHHRSHTTNFRSRTPGSRRQWFTRDFCASSPRSSRNRATHTGRVRQC